VEPSIKLMEPVGVPAALLALAVKVTEAPNVEGLELETSVTAVGALLTVTVAAALEDPIKFPLPPYTAVMLCEPPARAEVAKATAPLLETEALPSCVVPSKKVTVPVGVPAAGSVTAIVALIATFWPKMLVAGTMLIVVVVDPLLTVMVAEL
jgi:hypothetical protein